MKHTLIALSIAACLLIVGVTASSNALASDKEVQATDLVDIFTKLGGWALLEIIRTYCYWSRGRALIG